MADIQATGTTLSPPYAPAATGSTETATVPVSVNSVPAVLENLNRIIQINASVHSVPDAASITLMTALGTITVAMLPQLATTEKQKLIQRLLDLTGTKESLTLVMQPGSPPTQGSLLLTGIENPHLPQTPKNSARTEQPQTSQTTTLKTGTTLSAIVLEVTPDAEQPSPPAINAKLFPAAAYFTEQTATQPKELVEPPPDNNTLPQPKPVSSAAVQPIKLLKTEVLAAVEHPPAEQLSFPEPDATTLSQENNPFVMLQTSPQPPKVGAANIYAQTMRTNPLQTTPITAPQPSVTEKTEAINVINNAATKENTPAAPAPLLPAPAQVAPTVEAKTIVRPDIAAPKPQTRQFIAQPATPSPPPKPSENTPALPIPVYTPTETVTAPPRLKPGSEVVVRVVSVLPEAPPVERLNIPAAKPAPTELEAPPLQGHQVMAKVSGYGTDGQIILKTKQATLFIKDPISVPIGTSVVISIEPLQPMPLVTSPPTDEKSPHFQSLPQVLEALSQLTMPEVQHAISTRIPQPTRELPGALLFLLSAVKSGKASDWLGYTALNSLTMSGQEEVAKSISKEISTAVQTAQDPVVGHWRSYPIPLYTQNNFQEATLYVHNDRGARKDNERGPAGSGKIRFLIDMQLSKLGALQVDGFSQPKKLDIVMRSERMLPDGLHDELRTAYIKALDAMGFTGSISFQTGRQYWTTMRTNSVQGILT